MQAQKKARATPLRLSEPIEADLGQWWEGQPALYRKAHPDYVNSLKKNEIAKERVRT